MLYYEIIWSILSSRARRYTFLLWWFYAWIETIPSLILCARVTVQTHLSLYYCIIIIIVVANLEWGHTYIYYGNPHSRFIYIIKQSSPWELKIRRSLFLFGPLWSQFWFHCSHYVSRGINSRHFHFSVDTVELVVCFARSLVWVGGCCFSPYKYPDYWTLCHWAHCDPNNEPGSQCFAEFFVAMRSLQE